MFVVFKVVIPGKKVFREGVEVKRIALVAHSSLSCKLHGKASLACAVVGKEQQHFGDFLSITRRGLKQFAHIGRKLFQRLGRFESLFDFFDGAHDSTLITKEKAAASGPFCVLSKLLFFLPVLQFVRQGR